MKTKKIKNPKFKLFQYNLIKLQIYSNELFFDTINLSINIVEQIEVYLKQVLKVIFEYHVWQFKILFIGFPIVSNTKLLYFTNHDFITEKSWVSGIFRNRFSILTYLKLIQSQNFSKNIKLLLTIKTKPHLVVVFNQKIDNSLINEFYKTGIPIIYLNWDSLNKLKMAYKTLGSFYFAEKNIKLVFFFLFYSLLKKTPLKKRRKLNKIFRKKRSVRRKLNFLLFTEREKNKIHWQRQKNE